MKTILIAGGTGFIGEALIHQLLQNGCKVHVLKRINGRLPLAANTPGLSYFNWDIDQGFIEESAFEGVDALVNLTGANIGEKRWSTARKQELIDSRVKPISLLYDYVERLQLPLKLFISASAVGFYGAVTNSSVFHEEDAPGSDFLASVCLTWEAAAQRFKTLGIKTFILRKGVVIGKDGGIYARLAPLAKLGINVAVGSGKQYLPWVSLHDVVRAYDYILKRELCLDPNIPSSFTGGGSIEGVAGGAGVTGADAGVARITGDGKVEPAATCTIFNLVSSEQCTMQEFSNALLHSFGKSNLLPPAPAFVLRLAYGEMSVMLLEGSKVSNTKLKHYGFNFEKDSLKKAFGG